MESVLGITAGYNTKRRANVTSAVVAVLYNVPKGAMVKIFPTSAGTATVYSSGSPTELINADLADPLGAAIIASTNANWDQWGAGNVTAKTVQEAQLPLAAVALLVTSGTWVLEISA